MAPEKKDPTYQHSLDHCDAWDKMYKKYGRYNLAKKIMKLASYRAYKQRWPFDFSETISSIDDNLDIQAEQPSVEDIVEARLELDQLRRNLTPRELEVFDALMDGKTNSEVELELGFKTNNAARWHKHQIKKKYQTSFHKTVNDYLCRDCIWQFQDASGLECPKCGSRNTLLTKRRD